MFLLLGTIGTVKGISVDASVMPATACWEAELKPVGIIKRSSPGESTNLPSPSATSVLNHRPFGATEFTNCTAVAGT